MSLNYANYNFNAIVAQLTDKLKEKDPVWDSFESSTARTLIELFAYVGEMLMYTAERRAQESYLETAQLKSSVINIVRLINYQPRRIVSSTGTFTFSIASPRSTNVYIPKYTECQRNDGTKFLTSVDAILYAGSTSVNVSGIQGSLIQDPLLSDGSENQEFVINETAIENSNFFIVNESVQWTKVSSFVESQSASTHYRLILNNDETVTLRFGDNKFGKIPTDSTTINVSYIKSAGSSGNVFSTGVITTLNSTLFDENGVSVTVTVTNSSLFLGGDDAEDIDQIRYNAPRIFATAERAVTRSDYISQLEDYPSVAAVNVWGENEENPPNQDFLNKIRISILLDGWNLAGTTFRQTLSDFLKTKASLTVQYEFLDPDIIQLEAVVTASTAQNNSLSNVETAISSALDDVFSLGNVDIGETIRYGDVVQAIEAASGVLFSFTELKLTQTIGTGNGSSTTFTDILELTRIKDSSVHIYKDGVLTGYSNSADGLTTEVDKSPSGMIVTFNGVVISTKFFKFGTGSAKFNGINSYISLPDHPAANLSSGIWTIDVQVRPDVLQLGTIYYQQNDTNNYFKIYTTEAGAVGIIILSGGSTALNLVSPDGQIPVDTWTHLEFTEDGNTYNIFVNGSPVATTSNVNRPINYSGNLELGRDGTLGHYFSGHMDEFRLSKDTARNSVNFTSPVSAYSSDTSTSLLLHMNGFGRIVPVSGSGITGSVDYTYGDISVTFPTAPIANSIISAKYQQNENNLDLVPTKNQIIRLINKDITVNYVS
jgi:hypothetical protein